jgi:hypothetical protein
VWLTPEEKSAWKNKAASSGMNLNDYIRCCVEHRKIPHSLPEVNRVTAVEPGKIGVNCNRTTLRVYDTDFYKARQGIENFFAKL